MMITLTLPGSVRSKKNSKRIIMAGKRPRLIPSKAYLAWEKEIRQTISKGCIKPNIPLHVKVTAFYKGRRPDLSGVLESVGDCLEGFYWENDSQIESWDGSRLYHDKINPRTEVEIRRYEK